MSEEDLLETDRKGENLTLVGTSESKVTPLTENFPSERSKEFSKLLVRMSLRTELAGSFGGAMKNRGSKNRAHYLEFGKKLSK